MAGEGGCNFPMALGTVLMRRNCGAVFARNPRGVPEIHVFANAPRIERSDRVRLFISTCNADSGMRISVTAGDLKREVETVADYTSIDFDGGGFAVGDLPIHADLLDSTGRVLSKSETGTVIFDSQQLTEGLKQARVILAQVDDLIRQAQRKGCAADYMRIRANCLRYALNVADLAERGYSKADGTRMTFPAIRERAIEYIRSSVPALLADARKLCDGAPEPSSRPEFSVPTPNLLAPWTIRGNNILAGGIPIYTCGYIWEYGNVDTSYSPYDLGLNSEYQEVGPVNFLPTDYTLVSNIPNVFSCQINWGNIAASAGEVIDMMTQPAYLPTWFITLGEGKRGKRQLCLDGYQPGTAVTRSDLSGRLYSLRKCPKHQDNGPC